MKFQGMLKNFKIVIWEKSKSEKKILRNDKIFEKNHSNSTS